MGNNAEVLGCFKRLIRREKQVISASTNGFASFIVLKVPLSCHSPLEVQKYHSPSEVTILRKNSCEILPSGDGLPEQS